MLGARRWGDADADASPETRVARRLAAARLLPQVRRVTRAIGRALPPHVDRDDVYGAGCLGLAEALLRLPNAACPWFDAYAMRRVRGAIVDHLRASDVLNRRQRIQLAHLRETANTLRLGLGRTPSDSEIAQATGLSERRCTELSVMAEGRCRPTFEDDAGPIEATEPNPEALLLERLALSRLQRAREALAARLGTIVDLYYDEELTQSEIGRRLHVSEARVSQLRKDALDELRRLAGEGAA